MSYLHGIAYWIYAAILVLQCNSFKILVMFPFPAKSHSILGEGVVKHLLKAGHEVTYMTPFPKENNNSKLRQISVTENINAYDVGLINIHSLMKKEVKLDQDSIFEMMLNVTKKTLESNSVLNLLNDVTEHFDVVVSQWIFNEVFSGFAAVFNCPHIWFFPYEPNFVSLSLIDEATNPAYTANIEHNDIPPFTFLQRLRTFIFQATSMLKNYLIYRDIEMEIFERAFNPILIKRNKTLPLYEELRLNTSLILGNSHVSLGQALRLPQNYIPIGGQHIDENVKPLPKNLKKIMDGAKDGVIYFSMGSNLKMNDLPGAMKLNLIKMFSSLKQTVIWKFEDTSVNVSKNLHILDWAPQQSILAHPKCILFITHGGQLSTTEAVHFGVPIIGIPVYFDQLFNVDQSVIRGIGMKVDLTDNVAEDLKNAIREILDNSIYRTRMKEVSFIYHHRPTPPGRQLVHWVEHVVYTGGGTHLRSPALLLPWYQKIYADLVLLILALLFLMMHCTRLLYITQKQNKKKKDL